MIQWEFKEKILYQGEEISQDSRKFEILLELYLREKYPLENWKLTKSTRDGNRDLESICEFSGTSMWAEAKYTIHTDENISSRKYDSTLVSSMFENNLIKIFFITNTSIGSNLIGRIKKFYYLSKVEQIAFIDGYTLSHWIKKNHNIEKEFFKYQIKYTMPSSPSVQLKCVRVFCKSDSYTIDSVLEEQVLYPLYLSKNYIIEGEFTAFGFEDAQIALYCNDILLYQGVAPTEITTFSLDISKTKDTFNVNEEYSLNLYYMLNNEKYSCGEYNLKFATVGELYKKQVQNYKTIENGLKSKYKKIFNLHGPQSSGKSWLLTNIKNDLLKSAGEKQRIIYVNFTGLDSDVADICRIVFTLIFNYYNLSISADALFIYLNNKNIKNSFLSSQNVELVIHALQTNDYSMIQNVLKGAIFSQTEKIFELTQCFEYERIYFIDNVHLLSEDNASILQAILCAFDPMRDVSFVLTSRNTISGSNVDNLYLDYVEDSEILTAINEHASLSISDLNQIVPQEHYLMYPGLLHAFLQDIDGYTCVHCIKQYYINSFQVSASQYVKGDFSFDSIILLLICMVKEGIPMFLLQKLDIKELGKLFNQQMIVQRHGYICPNFERWNQYIPPEVIEKNNATLISIINQFMEQDSERKEIYQCAQMVYFPEYYNYYFESIFKCLKQKFNENKYSQVIFMCESLMKKKEFYVGNPEQLNYVKYYLAFSYLHCDASKDAYAIFQEITNDYRLKAKTALFFDAESENIDAQYWGFKDFVDLPCHINEFRKNWKESQSEIPNLQFRAYLTATNRMMVTYLALDRIKLADKWFRKNIKLAVEFGAYEHLGYTYMDYAKGIYHRDLSLALRYLEIADRYFQISSEHRRHLDCLCEIQYVQLLLGTGSIQELLLTQESLFENQYWIQYYKCHLKLAVCYILKGRNSTAIKHLMKAEAPAMMKNNERVTYLCSIIGSFLYQEPIPYQNEGLAGTSYQKIIDNIKFVNTQNKVSLYVMDNSKAVFCLDPRVW